MDATCQAKGQWERAPKFWQKDDFQAVTLHAAKSMFERAFKEPFPVIHIKNDLFVCSAGKHDGN